MIKAKHMLGLKNSKVNDTELQLCSRRGVKSGEADKNQRRKSERKEVKVAANFEEEQYLEERTRVTGTHGVNEKEHEAFLLRYETLHNTTESTSHFGHDKTQSSCVS